MIDMRISQRVSDILNTPVENRQREKLGTIQDLMADVDGRLKYAILSHGGCLGIGDVLIPIPFHALTPSGETGVAVLDIDKQTLEKALNFESKTWPDFTAAEWEEKIDGYFAAYAADASPQQTAQGCSRRPANRAGLSKGANDVCRTTNRRFNRSRMGRA
jgi:hypothetical protein